MHSCVYQFCLPPPHPPFLHARVCAFPVPFVLTARGWGCPCSGGAPVDIVGENFGPLGTFPNVSYHSASQPDRVFTPRCNVSVAHTRIRCLTEPGVGSGLQWQVSIGNQVSVGSNVGYCGPVVESLTVELLVNDSSPLGPAPASACPFPPVPPSLTGRVMDSEGRSDVVLTGLYFGRDASEVEVRGLSVRSGGGLCTPIE